MTQTDERVMSGNKSQEKVFTITKRMLMALSGVFVFQYSSLKLEKFYGKS